VGAVYRPPPTTFCAVEGLHVPLDAIRRLSSFCTGTYTALIDFCTFVFLLLRFHLKILFYSCVFDSVLLNLLTVELRLKLVIEVIEVVCARFLCVVNALFRVL